jgi:S1-C subfamily serine protease
MNRFQCLMRVFCAMLFFVVASVALARDDEKDKDKPKNAAMIDDAKGTLTETVDGKPKETKLDLQYCLKIKGYVDDKGLHIEEVDEDGPAHQVSNADGQGVQLEKGDIITEVDGKKIKSAQDYVKAMNGASDHAKTKIKVRDVRTEQEMDFVADAAKR